MAITKSSESVTDWTAVAQNAVGESSVIDCSGHYETLVQFQVALTSETTHDGTRFIIQVSSATSGDEDWVTLITLCPDEIRATATNEPIDDDPLSAGSTTIQVTDTNQYEYDKAKWIYIKDGTIANSEIVLLVSHVLDTSLTIQDGTTNEHAVDTDLYNYVWCRTIRLPYAANRARVIVDNTYDSGGSSLDYRLRITKMTAL